MWVRYGRDGRQRQRVEHVVMPLVAHTQIVAQSALGTEPEFFHQGARGEIVGVDESLQAVQAELAEAEIEERGNCLGGDALALVGGVDGVANVGALVADMAGMIIDHADAAIGCGIDRRPDPVIGRGAFDAFTHGALGLAARGVHWPVPVAHGVGIGGVANLVDLAQPHCFAGRQSGPTATNNTRILKATFDGFPDAKDPALSKQNQANNPASTVRRTPSGAAS